MDDDTRVLTEDELKEQLIQAVETMNKNIQYFIKEFENNDLDLLLSKDRIFVADASQTHINKIIEETRTTMEKVS